MNRIRIKVAEWLLDRAADLMAVAGILCIQAGRPDYTRNIIRVLEYGAKHERMDEKWSAR